MIEPSRSSPFAPGMHPPFAAAARNAARNVLEKAPPPEGTSLGAIAALHSRVSEVLAEALGAGLHHSLIHKAAKAAGAALFKARSEAAANDCRPSGCS